MNRHEDGADRYRLLPTQGETVTDSDGDALMAFIDSREHLSTSGIQEAPTYFESLNGKGRPLSQADLIRNYFFMRLLPIMAIDRGNVLRAGS